MAAEVIVGELGAAMAHLAELPARGVGADVVGRAGALLIDIALDTVPRGYQVTARPGAVTRRAVSLLAEDVDALEEAWEIAGLRGSGRPVKIQAPGPITLAAELELSNGHRAITDLGAFNDIAASLAEGVAAHRASVSRRLDTPVVVQFDEPSLPAAVAGQLTGMTTLSPVAAIEESLAVAVVDLCASAAGAEVVGALLCIADSLEILQRSSIDAVSVDADALTADDLDAVGEFVESGRVVMLGVVPSLAPARRPAVEEVATSLVADHRSDRLQPVGAARSDRHRARLRAGRCDPGVGPRRHRTGSRRRGGFRRRSGRHLRSVSVARCPHPTSKRCSTTTRCESSCTLTAVRSTAVTSKRSAAFITTTPKTATDPSRRARSTRFCARLPQPGPTSGRCNTTSPRRTSPSAATSPRARSTASRPIRSRRAMATPRSWWAGVISTNTKDATGHGNSPRAASLTDWAHVNDPSTVDVSHPITRDTPQGRPGADDPSYEFFSLLTR